MVAMTAGPMTGQIFDERGRTSQDGGSGRWREIFPVPRAFVPAQTPGASISSRRRRAKVRESHNKLLRYRFTRLRNPVVNIRFVRRWDVFQNHPVHLQRA